MDENAVDAEQDVPCPDAGVVGRAVPGDVQGDHRTGIRLVEVPIHPGSTVVGEMIGALLVKVDDGAADSSYCQDEQQRTDQLALYVVQSPSPLSGRQATPERTIPYVSVAFTMPPRTAGLILENTRLNDRKQTGLVSESRFLDTHYKKVEEAG